MKKLVIVWFGTIIIVLMVACSNKDAKNNSTDKNTSTLDSAFKTSCSLDTSIESSVVSSIINSVNPDLLALVYADRDDFVVDEELKISDAYESQLGEKDYLEQYRTFVSELNMADINKFYVAAAPSFKEGKAELTEQEFKDLLSKIKELNIEMLPEKELCSPLTGGIWKCYIETPTEAYHLSFNGFWFFVSQENEADESIFMCIDDLGLQKDIFGLLEKYLKDAKD